MDQTADRPHSPTERPLVLFVDDDIVVGAVDGYLQALQARFRVITLTAAEEVLPMLHRQPECRAIVLDIAMPVPPGASPARLDGGQLTGLWVMRQIRGVVEARSIAIVVLTNKSPQQILEPVIAEEPASYPRPELYGLHKKLETPAHVLPGIVVKRIETARS